MGWLTNIEEALKIKSPKAHVVGGPYCVVDSGEDNTWAVVALDWKWNGVVTKALGIRWFVDKPGMPSVFGHPMWFIIPGELYSDLLKHVNNEAKRSLLERYINSSDSYSGKDLERDINNIQ